MTLVWQRTGNADSIILVTNKKIGNDREFVLSFLLVFIGLGMVRAESSRNEDVFTPEYMAASGLTGQGFHTVQSIDWSGNTCYAYLDGMSVYTYQSGGALEKFCKLPDAPAAFQRTYAIITDADIEELENTVTYIVARGDALYGYNVYDGKFGFIDAGGIHWDETRLDMQSLNPEQSRFPNRVARSLLTEQKLYTFVSTGFERDGTETYTFFGFDLSTGEATVYEVDRAVGVCYEQGENFLFLRRDEKGYRISRLDSSINALTDLSIPMEAFPANTIVGGLAYDAANDAIFLATQGQVFQSIAGSRFKPVAYVPTDGLMPETQAWALPDGRYALGTMNGMFVRAKEERLNRQQLVIQTYRWANEQEVFAREYPDVDLNYIYQPITAEEVTQMLVTQDDSVDVFEVCVDYAYSALVDKGYTTDLSASEVIKTEVASMDGSISSALMDAQGRIVAYPTQLRFWSSGIHEGYWKLAFEDRPLPSNMDELMDAWIEWETDYAEEYPDIEFSIGFDYTQYCQKVITFYVQQHDISNEQPDLQDPVLRNVLEKLRQVYEIRKAAGRSTTDSGMASPEGIASIVRFRGWDSAMYEPSTTVAMLSENVLYGMYMWDYTPLALTFAAGDTVQTDGTMYVYIVNPNSPNRDAAIHFVECVTRLESEPYIYYAIHPAYNVPYEWPDFQKLIASFVEDKEYLENILQNTNALEPAELGKVQAMLDFRNQYLANREKEKWMISAETIAKHRVLLGTLNLHANSLYLGAPGAAAEQMIAELCARYTQGGITMDAFLNELSGKMQMMRLENY